MKDNDLREKIFLNPDDKDKMLDNMTRDADFLLAQNIMDYSLLVGIEKGISTMEHPDPQAKLIADDARKRDSQMVMHANATNSAQMYYVGIIDILQVRPHTRLMDIWLYL
jgi:hypothetical protein